MAIDTVALEAEARFLMGSLPVEVLSSETMQFIINKGISVYSDADEDYCLVLQYTIINSLKYLIRQQAVDNASNNVYGNITSIEEEEGDVRKKETYSTSTAYTLSSWDDLLDYFLKNPQEICESLGKLDGSGIVIVGDGDVNGSTAAIRSRNRIDESAYNEKRLNRYPWRPSYPKKGSRY